MAHTRLPDIVAVATAHSCSTVIGRSRVRPSLQTQPDARRRHREPRVVAALAGGGWTFSRGGGKQNPILTWLVFDNGDVKAVAVDLQGLPYYLTGDGTDPGIVFTSPLQVIGDSERPIGTPASEQPDWQAFTCCPARRRPGSAGGRPTMDVVGPFLH